MHKLQRGGDLQDKSATSPSTVHGTKWFHHKYLWNQIWQILTFLTVHFTICKMGMEPNMTQNVVVENKLRLRMWKCLKTKDVFFKNLSLYTYFSFLLFMVVLYKICPFITWRILVIVGVKMNTKLACDVFQPWIFFMRIWWLFLFFNRIIPALLWTSGSITLGSKKLFLDN